MADIIIAVTGATGFVGRALISELSARGLSVRALLRRAEDGDGVVVGDIGPETDWHAALDGAHAVIHAAARVHIMNDKVTDPLAEFRRVNVSGTLNLARQAVAAGVRRFVFISSIKVNGEQTQLGRPFSANDTPAPVDPYG